jgi:excisionase family DNA binding protein
VSPSDPAAREQLRAECRRLAEALPEPALRCLVALAGFAQAELLRVLPDAPNGRLLLTAAEAARAMAISDRHLWTLTNTGAIPAVPLGRSVRYDPRDLAAFIEAQKAGAFAAAEGT